MGLIERATHFVTRSLVPAERVRLCGEPFFWLTGKRRKGQTITLAEVKRLLIVRLDEIGDVVMTTPLLREFRRNLPDAWITLVVNPLVRNLVEKCPYVNEVLTFDGTVPISGQGPLLSTDSLRELHQRALQFARRNLWKRDFDLAVLPRWDSDYYHGTFLAYFSGAPWRLGHADNVGRLPQMYRALSSLLTHVVEGDPPRHEVQRNLQLIHFLSGRVESDALELWLGETDSAFADEVLKSHSVAPDELLIAFCIGSRIPKKIWPTRNFVELAGWMAEAYRARIVLVGGPADVEPGNEFQAMLAKPTINLIGQTTLRQAAALLQRCGLYVGNDSGPMHIAAAFGRPVIEVCCHPADGSPAHHNSPRRFGPWAVPQIVFQPEVALAPCVDECAAQTAHCIAGIDVEQVKREVSRRIKYEADSRSIRICD